jgi:hypothetical protein
MSCIAQLRLPRSMGELASDRSDHPDLDHREVSPELQRIRGPFPIAAGVEAYVPASTAAVAMSSPPAVSATVSLAGQICWLSWSGVPPGDRRGPTHPCFPGGSCIGHMNEQHGLRPGTVTRPEDRERRGSMNDGGRRSVECREC